MTDVSSKPSFSGAVSPRDATADAPCQVGDLGRTMRDYIARLGSVWVEGEITEWNVRSVGIFATVKDLSGDGIIRAVVWSSVRSRIPDDIKAGDHVVLSVKPDYRVNRGEISYVVSSIKHVGLGDILERLERLRQQLASEGLLDASRKKRLPFLPGRIGLITGKASDAEKDVLRNAQLRWPQVDFRVINTAVQGEQSVPQILDALATLDADPTVDVIIIARGGGDFQDLLGFSDERLLRAVAAADTPVVSAIGHENDRPLLDEVADLRASTPTDAAKRVVPDVMEQLAMVRDARARITGRVSMRLTHEQNVLDQLRSRPVLREPARMLEDRSMQIAQGISRARAALDLRLERGLSDIASRRATLRALSPQDTLNRGYAIVQGPAGVVRSPSEAPAGATLTIRLADGALDAVSQGEITRQSADEAN